MIEYAEPDYIYQPKIFLSGCSYDRNKEDTNKKDSKFSVISPNDPYYNSSKLFDNKYKEDLWGLKKIKAHQVWSKTQGENVIVGVIDTGVDYNHPDIKKNMWINKDEIGF